MGPMQNDEHAKERTKRMRKAPSWLKDYVWIFLIVVAAFVRIFNDYFIL